MGQGFSSFHFRYLNLKEVQRSRSQDVSYSNYTRAQAFSLFLPPPPPVFTRINMCTDAVPEGELPKAYVPFQVQNFKTFCFLISSQLEPQCHTLESRTPGDSDDLNKCGPQWHLSLG